MFQLKPVNVPFLLLALFVGVALGILVGKLILPKERVSAGPKVGYQGSDPITSGEEKPVASAGIEENTVELNLDINLQRAVDRGVQRADALDGTSAAAIVTAGKTYASSSLERFRLWSTSKVITSLMLVAQTGGSKTGQAVPPEVQEALVQSSNCAQRLIVNELQIIYGSIELTKEAFEQEADSGEATVGMETVQSAPPEDTSCDEYLIENGIKDPNSASALFGTAEWRAEDAASLMWSLQKGVFGPAGEGVLETLRLEKEANLDPGSSNSVEADLGWGAGNSFAGLDPAYKSGWGGSGKGDYIVSQMVSLDVNGKSYGVSATFRPTRQPATDVVSQGVEVKAIETIFREIRKGIEAMEQKD
jgi:hypothetical protein